MAKIKTIDVSTEIPIDIKFLKKKSLSNTVLFEQKEIIVESSKISSLYTIFSLEYISEKFLLTYEEILIMLYLYELGLFKLKITIINESFNVSNFIGLGYIVEDYSYKKTKLYKLSEKGINIVAEYLYHSKNNDTYISCNRQIGVDLDSKVKSTLSNYLKD